MEAVSALRIELYNELQGLPEALRSDFPDLAVDFLATVFRPAGTVSPAKPTQSARPADPPTRERRAPLSQFRLLPPSATDDKDALAVDGRVQDMLEAVQREAASIEATAGATPATGWGDLALPLVVAPAEQLKQLTAQQRSVGGRRSPSPAVGRPLPPPPPPAQLLECRRCRKVLMACAAVQHQRQCSQLPEATVAQPGGEASLSPSEGRSSSDGVPAPAPSASRGSKRKRPSGSVAPGGAKASRMSKGGSMRAGSVELTPSIGEVVQGKLQPPVQPLPTAQQVTAQQQQARAQRYYEQCRIFSSLGPDQQQRLRQIATQRQKTQAAQQQQQQQQQGQAGIALPGQLQHMQQQMGRPGMQVLAVSS
ncbi:KH domain- RNA- signal transduction-associated 3 [Chlorella sorokiniana]|uniref:KH domain-RNA-signal transduction-associated 3 n=1 Tax=Chlorella sorokiniana TaxID=3076 RepID=A0A2P6U550_CHLSO|nr:KH domain- RNA- signal transduction-associated 3 [Chlorella sorokiniana]|eukprot:PRW61439.1 KH domain- RNA- signal transduction-associated 3 [Chlorella sorokiniana]